MNHSYVGRACAAAATNLSPRAGLLSAARKILPLYVLLAASLFADTIEMKPTGTSGEGLKLEGTVEREEETYIILTAHESKAAIRIPRSKIKSIEYDIRTQINRLEEDDVAGRFKVGLWAMDKAMYADAIEVFEEIKEEEGVPVDVHKQLGLAYEQRKQLDMALESYSEYLLSRPDDTVVKEKVAALMKEVKPEPEPGVAAAPAVKKVVDGLEADGNWVAEKWGNPATVQFTTDATGNKMIVLQAATGAKDKYAISRTGAPLNLSDSKEMVFRVFHNSPQPIAMAIGFNNSQGEFHETKQLTRIAPEKWNNLAVRIDSKEFKAERNKFQAYDLALAGPERINQVIFLIYGQRDVTVYIDSLFFKASAEGEAPAAPAAPGKQPAANKGAAAPVPAPAKPVAPAAPVLAKPAAKIPAKAPAAKAAGRARPAKDDDDDDFDKDD